MNFTQHQDYDPIRASDGVIARLRALHPTLIDLSTGRVERLLEALGRPQDRLKNVVHVAGTNGKGSTTAFVRAIVEASGMTAHVLTSPHLVRFAERIRVAGTLISDEALGARIAEVEAANGGAPISFFEITTVIAIHAFALTPADVSIIEVGLGGRFDATNVFSAPAVSVITPVDYDHVDWLGPELTNIAWEKAGIIKAGRPVVVGRQSEAALAVIEAEADSLGAPVQALGRDFDAWRERGRLVVQTASALHDLPLPALAGDHQVDNAALAVAAAVALGDPRLDEAALGAGVAAAKWPARFQRVSQGPLAALAGDSYLWLDGAHNPHAARALARLIGDLATRDGRPVALIVGLLGRKDANGFFAAFTDLAPHVVATSFASPSATPPEVLVAAARNVGLEAEAAAGVEDAIGRARRASGAPGHIVVCGSLHFAGDVLALSPETWPT